jgi:uncharacterized protein YbaR (Trm112 family)
MGPESVDSYLASILVCSACRGELHRNGSQLTCARCRAFFSIQNGVPIFLPERAAVAQVDHRSNPLGAEFEAILREGKDFVLHIGAGATVLGYPNCIEFEHQIFRHTDVVGDAHQLPFRDNVFDQVFAFNVFEHLANPKKAAAEILRVLKPGGSVAIHTAFLQPLHEEPAHFYNATVFGVREWFTAFEIDRCQVSGNFSPGYMLGFLISTVLETMRSASIEERTRLGQTSLDDWASFWQTRGVPPPGFDALENLPQSLQQGIAAGFELIAHKPAA